MKSVFRQFVDKPRTFREFIRSVRQFFGYFFEIVKCCRQRITRGYSDEDVFGMDSWFLEIIPEMLEQLAEKSNTFPTVFYSEAVKPEELDMIDEDGECESVRRWKEILCRMAFCFKEASKYSFPKDRNEELDRLEIEERRAKYMKEGLELFEKYFRYLWY